MAEDLERLVVQLSADMRRYERSMQRVSGSANTAARRVETRFDRMNRNLQRSGQSLNRVLSRAFAPLLAGATVAGLARVTSGALEAAEAIQDLSNRASVSAEFLQEMRFIASQNGASTRDFDDAISRLNRRLGLFISDGGGPAAAAFERLGLAQRIARGELTDTESVYREAVRALEGVENAAVRSATASELFGDDAGPRLAQMLSLGSAAMEEQRARAHDLGLVMSQELVDNAAAAADALERMNMQFSAQINMAVAENASELESLAVMLGNVASSAIAAASGFTEFVQQVDSWDAPRSSEQVAMTNNRLEAQAERARLRRLQGRQGSFGMGSDRREQLRREIAEAENNLAVLDAQYEQLAMRAQQDISRRASVSPAAPQQSATPSVTPVRNAGGFETSFPGREEIPAPRLHPERQAEAYLEALLRLSQEKASQFGNAQAKAHIDAMEARRGEYREFFRDGFRNGILAALDGNAGEALSAWWREYVTRALSGVLDNLADRLFDIVTSASGSGGGLGSAISAVFGGARANGGDVRAGQAYRVGEHGRSEIFMPTTNGKVLPIDSSVAGRSTGGVSINQSLVVHAEGAVSAAEVYSLVRQGQAASSQQIEAAVRSMPGRLRRADALNDGRSF